ncbi:MAG: 4-alpha-glucanotransferase [Planctomycetaceae bacterium]
MSNEAPRFPRSCGVLLHPTSLPGPHGVGDLGAPARRLLEFLQDAGQRWWQMLPVVPAGEADSPYKAYSAFAGEPLLLSLDDLAEEGLLASAPAPLPSPPDRVEFDSARSFKMRHLQAAYGEFRKGGGGTGDLLEEQGAWLPDYALFCALKEEQAGRPWWEWPVPLRVREPAAMEEARTRLELETAFHVFLQWLFQRQWKALRLACASAGVRLIGDLPIFVALDSAEVWARPELFRLDARGAPEAVAGVPPDYFNEEGQLWGNPLYRWDVMEADRFSWWTARLRAAYELFDAVRLDHFLGFCRGWEVPAGARSAKEGRYVPGPGAAFFEAILAALPGRHLIAEDLGAMTREAAALRDRFALPGMRVVQFAFGEQVGERPHAFPRNAAVYSGTHDNDTAVGWTASHPREHARLLEYLGVDGREGAWDLIRCALASECDLAVVPAQDLLGLGTKARMNRPGVARGNWSWRLGAQALDGKLAARLRRMAAVYGR